jgi:hypothetical protein
MAWVPWPGVAAAQPADPYILTVAQPYDMLPGPEGVVWCAGQIVSADRPFAPVPWPEHLQAIRLASLSQPGAEQPEFQVLLPAIGQLPNFTLALAPGGRLYYADTLPRPPMAGAEPWSHVRVYAYLTPAEFAALLADPSGCLSVRAEDVTRPEELYQQLMTEPWRRIVEPRAGELLEEAVRLHEPLLGPPNPNEPWLNPKPDPQGFAACLLQLVNRIIGDEQQAVSLYQRARYADRQLPVQIIEVMRRIHELGGPYDGTPVPSGPGAGPTPPADDPWRRFRPKPRPEAPTSTPEAPAASSAVTQQIRLLNRLLLEYEFQGLLVGTMYRSVQDFPAYQPSLCLTDVGRFVEGAQVLAPVDDGLYPLMPLRIGADGAIDLLLEPRSAEAAGVEPAYYRVGPGGELSAPLAEAFPGQPTPGIDPRATYAVWSREPRWVTVDAGQPAAAANH